MTVGNTPSSDGRLAPVLAQQWGPALVFWATPGGRHADGNTYTLFKNLTDDTIA